MPSSIEDVMKAYDSLFRQWLNLGQPFISATPVAMASSEGDCASISRALLQALSTASTSSLSYGYSLQSLLYKYQASLLALNFGGEDAAHKRALLLDETRRFLREIGDTASHESRKFQHQLSIISEQLAQEEAKAAHGPTDVVN